MSTTSVLDRVDAAAAHKREQLELGYLDLVDTLARGDEDVPSDIVLDVATSVGRTPAQLRADVERKVERRRLAALAESKPAAEAEHAKALAQLEKVTRERDAALAKSNANIAQLNGVLTAAISQVRAAKAAQVQLRNGASPERKAHLEALQNQRPRAEAEVASNRAEVARLEGIEARPVPTPRDESRQPYGSVIDRERGRREEAKILADARSAHEYATGALPGARGRLAAAERQLEHLDAQIAAATAALLLP